MGCLQITRNHAILTDLDLTLLPSTSTEIDEEQQKIIFSLLDHFDGAVAVITGRRLESVEEVFPGIPASLEHHSAWRPERGQAVQVLAPDLNVKALAGKVLDGLSGKFNLVRNILHLPKKENGVHVQYKNHSLAMIFTPEVTDKMKLAVGTKVHEIFIEENLGETHQIKTGSDAVEIVHLAACKGKAVRDFMKMETFAGRTPVYFGDSLPDLLAMSAVRERGGYNVAVGNTIKGHELVDHHVPEIAGAWNIMRNFDRQLNLTA